MELILRIVRLVLEGCRDQQRLIVHTYPMHTMENEFSRVKLMLLDQFQAIWQTISATCQQKVNVFLRKQVLERFYEIFHTRCRTYVTAINHQECIRWGHYVFYGSRHAEKL